MTKFVVPKKWQIAKKTETDLIRQILVNRGVKDLIEQKKFLKPNFEQDFLDPFLLKDMKKAVDRIAQAIRSNERIGIFGDYDADGIPATAIMVKGFSIINYENIIPIIPNREDGYGLNQKAVDLFSAASCSLLITLDNGVSAKESVALAREKGIDVIIIDHHEVQSDKKPTNCLIINPKQKDCHYPEKMLCASALAFKLLWALFLSLNKKTDQLKWLLDLVAISTIADLVPLIGENRLLAYYGLIILNRTKNLGLLKIYQNASLKLGQIDTYQVGFIIAPRLNAPSRMGQEKDITDQANLILKLLVTEDEKEASRLAKLVSDLNEERQQALEKARKEAIQLAEKQVEENRRIIVLANPKWPTGIVGLVASKIVEAFARPAFVFGKIKDNLVGSARSIKQFDLVKNLSEISQNLKKFGGHKLAAGVTINKNKYDKFINSIEKQGNKILSDDDLVKLIKVDAQFDLDKITIKTVKIFQKLAPFGMANPQPIFLVRGKIYDLRLMGKDSSHLSFWLEDNQKNRLKVVAFSQAHLAKQLKSGQEIEVLANLKIDTWNDNESARLFYIDHHLTLEN